MRFHPRIFSLLLVVLLSAFSWALSSLQAAERTETVQDISISLVNEEGRTTYAFALPVDQRTPPDVLFRASVDTRHDAYISWGLEITDPSRNLSYRMTYDGSLPSLIHWDGSFNEADSVQPNRRYFMRLFLIFPGGRILSSEWAFFSSRRRNLMDDAPKLKGNYISLYVLPSGSISSAIVFTKSYRNQIFPNILGDIQVIYKDTHSFGLKLEATSNILFNYAVTDTGFFYSDFSLYYKYRILGSPARAPALPASPPLANYRYVNSYRPELFGALTNSSTLR